MFIACIVSLLCCVGVRSLHCFLVVLCCVGVRQNPLFMLYWCLSMPWCCALLVFVKVSLLCSIGACWFVLTYLTYLFNPLCLLPLPCCVLLLLINVSLMCSIGVLSIFWRIFPPYIFLCKCASLKFQAYFLIAHYNFFLIF